MGVFFKRSRAANSAARGRILPNFEHIRDIMVVLHTCKNEEDPIKNEHARVLTRLYEPRHEKTNICICENKDADQLRGNREADQRLCFRYINSTIPLLSKSKISSLYGFETHLRDIFRVFAY